MLSDDCLGELEEKPEDEDELGLKLEDLENDEDEDGPKLDELEDLENEDDGAKLEELEEKLKMKIFSRIYCVIIYY